MAVNMNRPRVTAVLGPTNTGKTYLAIERMLGHGSGMIGFPLRLLARENYDRVVKLVGARNAALVTGEEKIVPPGARYFLCTVESMPLDRPVDFLAIDEIQLCADPERGHVFSDRLLRARGAMETMLLGADTMRPVVRALVPDAEFISRPRFSRLSYSGPKKLSRIPPRSAVVAFSANDVYALAEAIRRGRGGAAVVLGALSPRTRNAQVAMFQAGEVDYLVATDAIGMGLNMDVDHVSFWRLRKFDGRTFRPLETVEIAQIAGRAGRHMNDGTFGTVAELGPLEDETVAAIESHHFKPLAAVWWRNAELRFDSPRTLLASLDAPPPLPMLVRARQAEDHLALARLAQDPEIARRAVGREAVGLLWDVCQIPDFRKTMTEAHARLLARIYLYLRGPDGRLPTDWVANQLAHLDRTDGDLDTLMARIAHVRTWTYVSHRPDWLDDAGHWQERARAIEDRLSDALHERLMQRFVDRRAAALIRLRGRDDIAAHVESDGGVSVEGAYVGRLEGFRFAPDGAASAESRRMLTSTANKALGAEIAQRLARLEADEDMAFTLVEDGAIAWHGVRIAQPVAGGDPLSPQVRALPSAFLSSEMRSRIEARLGRWLAARCRSALGPLYALREAPLSGAVRGLAFQLGEALGSMRRRDAAAQLSVLSPDDRRTLRQFGVRLGMESIWMPALMRPHALALRALLWSVFRGEAPLPPPAPGLVTLAPADGVPAAFYEAVGYRRCGRRAVRIDILERLSVRLLRLARRGSFPIDADMMSLLGLAAADAAEVIAALGYRDGGDGLFAARPRRRARDAAAAKSGKRAARIRRRPARPVNPDSPFAKLAALRIG
jgi:ATP-dependent RNA helicase SUPV3L1/SUV3